VQGNILPRINIFLGIFYFLQFIYHGNRNEITGIILCR
jgi:hypothetical protein